jgi:hypothetical protein
MTAGVILKVPHTASVTTRSVSSGSNAARDAAPRDDIEFISGLRKSGQNVRPSPPRLGAAGTSPSGFGIPSRGCPSVPTSRGGTRDRRSYMIRRQPLYRPRSRVHCKWSNLVAPAGWWWCWRKTGASACRPRYRGERDEELIVRAPALLVWRCRELPTPNYFRVNSGWAAPRPRARASRRRALRAIPTLCPSMNHRGNDRLGLARGRGNRDYNGCE